jgi:peptide/nickel transport system permease protein
MIPHQAVTADTPAPPPEAVEAGGINETASVWRAIARVFVTNRLATAALILIILIALFCFLGPVLYHTNQNQTDLAIETRPPSASHPLGTDAVGFDQLGRLMLAGQSSLEVGVVAALLAGLFGSLWGATAGYLGGWVDAVMMRIVDSFLAIPFLLLALLFASIITPTIPILIVIVAMVSWLMTARLVRGDALSIRTREYVQAAKGVGARPARLVFRHIGPNAMGTIVVQTTFSVADAILLIAALSFLGLGLPPPAASWGQMLSDGINYIYDGYWWLIYPPGIMIILTGVSFNIVGDALRDSFEVRLQKR